MSKNQTRNDTASIAEKSDNLQAPLRLTGFKRDLLFVIAKLEGQRPHGKEIKREISEHYTDEINTGRLYQNLRELTDQDFVATWPIDGRTKAYHVSDLGHEWLEAYQEWTSECMQTEDACHDSTNQHTNGRPNRR